jgi:hypothetical protein
MIDTGTTTEVQRRKGERRDRCNGIISTRMSVARSVTTGFGSHSAWLFESLYRLKGRREETKNNKERKVDLTRGKDKGGNK